MYGMWITKIVKRILGRLGENKNESRLILENGMDYIQRSHLWLQEAQIISLF